VFLFLDASSIFAVLVATILVALCSDVFCISHHDRQLTAIPICPPDDKGEVILDPKPENCSEFYQCAGGVVFTQHCPVNLYYCAEKKNCTWRYDTDCAFDCVFTKTNPVPAAEEHVPAAIPKCPVKGKGTFILFPNPNDCSTYYDCVGGLRVLRSCAPGLYFNPQKQICSSAFDTMYIYDCRTVQTFTSSERIANPSTESYSKETAKTTVESTTE
jgi:hypothetical protein